MTPLDKIFEFLKLIQGVLGFFMRKANKHANYFVLKTVEDGKKLFIKNIGETAKNILIRIPGRNEYSVYFNWNSQSKEPFSLENGQAKEIAISTRRVIKKMEFHKWTNNGLKELSFLRRLIPFKRHYIWQSSIESIFYSNALIKDGIKKLKIEVAFENLDNTKYRKYYLSQRTDQEWVESK